MEFVHDHGGNVPKLEPLGVQQAVEQNLRHDDQDAGAGVDLAVAGHHADVFALEPPPLRHRLHFLELLLGQRDQRRRVIGRGLRVQRFKQCRLGDERFPRPRGRAHQHALLGHEPRQQRLFLHRVRRVRQLVEVQRC